MYDTFPSFALPIHHRPNHAKYNAIDRTVLKLSIKIKEFHYCIKVILNFFVNWLPPVLNIELQLDKLKPNVARRTLLLDSHQPYIHFQLTIRRETFCKNLTAYLLVGLLQRM